MSDALTLALWQGPAQPGPEAALTVLEDVAAAAAARGADLLVMPEMFLTGYDIGAARVAALAMSVDGDAMRRVGEMSRRHGIGIVVGFPEADAAGVFNSAALIEGGDVVSVARKAHLFGEVDAAQFVAADALPGVATFRGWRVAMAICYDVEFPELVRHHALAGAEVLLVPTANFAPFESVSARMVPVRAEENAVFVAYANYVGREGRFEYCGGSCICGPDVADIARAGAGPETILGKIRRGGGGTHLGDRRADLYG